MRWRVVLIATWLLAVLNGSAWAWEQDFHYGLTKWLALKAGFSSTAAETVARGNQEVDEGILDAVNLVGHYACFYNKDDNASKLVQEHHFPGFGPVPGKPQDRSVDAGSNAAIRNAEQEIASSTGNVTDPREIDVSLEKFGRALHAAQDSWSHHGIPDIPRMWGQPASSWVCDVERAWGHPEARGGWNQHFADHTSYGNSDVPLEASRKTYELMQRYLSSHPWAKGKAVAPSSWNHISKKVIDFINARTKTGKRNWFRDEGIPTEFLEGITLDDGPESFPLSTLLKREPTKKIALGMTSYNVPADAMDFFWQFFNDWITRQDDKFLNHIDIESVSRGRNLTAESNLDKAEMVATAFKMWRFRDHGLVAKFGHGTPPRDGKYHSELDNFLELSRRSRELAEKDRVRFETVKSAMLSVNKEGPPFTVFEVPYLFAKRWVAFGQFRHTPYDIVIVTAEKAGHQWRVVDFAWTVEH